MKTKLIIRAIGSLVIMVSIFLLSSCSKNADQSLTKEQKAQQDSGVVATAIDEKDITESAEDLTTVDYKEFYDQLSPYGEWVEVSFEDIGLKPPTASLKSSGNNNSVIANILGIKTAYADANVAMTFVWKPSPEYAMVSTVDQSPQYVPYSNGQWVNSDAGWYFKAPTPWEETVHHQGRWVNSPSAGWMWVPGRVWAPAWVDWKQNDDYVSWAPLPPAVYYNTAGGFSNTSIDNNNYAIVERGRFLEPDIYRYSSPYYESGSRISMDLFAGTVGLVVVDNMIINRGPDVKVIQTYYPNNIINVVNVRHVRSFNEVRYSDREYFVYSPVFKRYKNKGHPEYRVYEPKSYKKYAEWKDVKNEQKEYNKEIKKQDKEFSKEVKNQQKEYNKGYKNNESGRKNSGNENIKYEKGNKNQNKNKENVKQNKGNNNEKQNKGRENVKQNKGNNNEKQNKGRENVKQNKGNNNEKQNKGNNNEKQNKGNNNEKQNKGNNNEKGKNK
jgi:hypothetical protein